MTQFKMPLWVDDENQVLKFLKKRLGWFPMLCIITIALLILILIGAKLMSDFSKLNASVAKLATDVDLLVAATANDQPQIDAAQAAVDAADAKVVAATPAPTV